MMMVIPVLLCSFLILLLLPLFLQWHHSKDRRLPPGSMGWPYIGETLKMYTENPNSFFSNRQIRKIGQFLIIDGSLFNCTYGDIFKTHILGCPCVMISSPEAARVVLVKRAHLFKPTYPTSKEKMIGPEAIFFQQGAYHARLKKLVQASFLPSAIKEKQHLEMEGIKHLYRCLEKGYNSMPLDLPGTPFHKAMKARKQLNETLRRLIEKRRQSGKEGGGLLGVLLGAKDEKLNDSQIADNINWGKIDANRRFTWNDTRRMPLASRVIQETLRRASILSFTFREAVEDLEFEDYFIPRGWKVRGIHHCADFFPQPQKFDPSRFEVPPRSNTYMPFGNGVHSCPGSELAKLETLILLHHLTITYRWRAMEDEDGIEYAPFPVPKRGLPIRLTPRPNHKLAKSD
ncbi:hypothetical protein P3X46_028916 [Hevea brasiliensis]|uniref:Cytochrome P450 n=1 Tax=Hevea brasiliensis TaxID=3981 RepID=A0ABQ9KQK9_HEVBR|nr:hypothetical protein P3X46_028916 [Hevea brasiliensis]